MRKESTESRSESRPEWEQLEDWVRSQVQRLIQELLEEEVTAFLGRAKSALRSDSDNDTGYRNGYGRARRLTLSSGTIQLRRPRVRDTEEQFESRLLPLFVNRTRKVAELIPELYLHGAGSPRGQRDHQSEKAGNTWCFGRCPRKRSRCAMPCSKSPASCAQRVRIESRCPLVSGAAKSRSLASRAPCKSPLRKCQDASQTDDW